MIIRTDKWQDLKNILSNKNLDIQYWEDNNNYYVFCFEGVIVYIHNIKKENPASSDQSDFETNYKPNANTSSVIRYSPRIKHTTTSKTLTSSDQSLLSITGNGQVDFISFRFSEDIIELAVFVDGNECYRVNLEELEDDHKLKSDEEDLSFESPIVSGNIYQEKWYKPIDFSSSFEVKAKIVTGSSNMLTGLIRYRIKI